jgi:hypothetical protein
MRPLTPHEYSAVGMHVWAFAHSGAAAWGWQHHSPTDVTSFPPAATSWVPGPAWYRHTAMPGAFEGPPHLHFTLPAAPSGRFIEGIYVLYTYAALPQTSQLVQKNLSTPEAGSELNILRCVAIRGSLDQGARPRPASMRLACSTLRCAERPSSSLGAPAGMLTAGPASMRTQAHDLPRLSHSVQRRAPCQRGSSGSSGTRESPRQPQI